MSILIKGLKIPKNCCECFAFKTNASGMMFCRAGKTAFEKEDAEWLPLRVSDHCPLIELPDHGNLIDREALANELGINTFDCEKCRWYKETPFPYCSAELDDECTALEYAEIIIPAERSEE